MPTRALASFAKERQKQMEIFCLSEHGLGSLSFARREPYLARIMAGPKRPAFLQGGTKKAWQELYAQKFSLEAYNPNALRRSRA